MRAMALYNWPEEFDYSSHPEFLAALVEDAGIRPTKLEVKLESGKRKRATVRQKDKFMEVISKLGRFSSFEFCRPIAGNYLNLESDMQCSIAHFRKRYLIARPEDKMQVTDLLRHVELFCSRVTPQYGFSHVMDPPSAAIFYLGGAGTTSMTRENNRRAKRIGSYLIEGNIGNASYDRLIDIYEFNVLSPAHLSRHVFGQPLASWIASGSRGELVEINSRVSVWIVPDAVRPMTRGLFLNAGLLEVDI